jgi:hypothetical protein
MAGRVAHDGSVVHVREERSHARTGAALSPSPVGARPATEATCGAKSPRSPTASTKGSELTKRIPRQVAGKTVAASRTPKTQAVHCAVLTGQSTGSDTPENPHWRVSVSNTTPRRVVGTVLSEHHLDGPCRYRWWEGSITVELLLLVEPTVILAVVPGRDRPGCRSACGPRDTPRTRDGLLAPRQGRPAPDPRCRRPYQSEGRELP